jgi:hypothetical protein
MANDRFGRYIATTSTGNVVVIGAADEDGGGVSNGDQSDNSYTESGAVYI